MSEDSTTQCLLFPGIFRKPVVAQFDQREGSSDGGALLLKAADRHYDLVAGLASCLRDDRQAGKVDHSLRELVAQRVFSIACGYPDANDSARLSEDPIHKLLLDRDPIEGRDLASQPTLSRFENGVGVKELYRLGEFLAESVIRRYAMRLCHRAYRVTIDLDPTDDPTHGAQQLSFFNGHYDTWCYLPVMGFVSFNDEAEQYLCAAVLRPGNVTAAAGAVAILRRLVRMIRHHFPGVQIRVRLDGGFAHPAVLEFLDAQPKLEYVVAMAKNAVLKRVAETGMRRARQLSRCSGKTEHIYGEVRYKAGKWPGLRRVIIKAEVVRAAVVPQQSATSDRQSNPTPTSARPLANRSCLLESRCLGRTRRRLQLHKNCRRLVFDWRNIALVLKNSVRKCVFLQESSFPVRVFLAVLCFLRGCHCWLCSHVEEPHQSFQVLCRGS
jgi:Transposase DDE domain group 1